MSLLSVAAAPDFERHEMPDGSVVYYRDRDHSYWRDIKARPDGTVSGTGRLTGVTTVVAPLDFRPDNLLDWACRMEHDGVAALVADALSLEEIDDMRAALHWLGSGDAIRAALQDAALLHSDARDRAAQRGTNVHKHALHALATGRSVPDFDAMTDEERGYARGVMAFWHEHEPEPIDSEQVVWSAALGVAGRFDLRCRLRRDLLDEELALVDCKTSGYISAKAHGQLALYEVCAIECGIGPSDRRMILQVDADGGYELIPVRCTPKQVVCAVATYRAAGEISRLAGKDRRER